MLVKLKHPRFGPVYLDSTRILFFHPDGGTAGDTLITLQGGVTLHVHEDPAAVAALLRGGREDLHAQVGD